MTARNAEFVTLDTARGPVSVPVGDIVVERFIAPDRRRILALERIAALGWRPETALGLDGWQLRADHGWTRRANSVLPLATPGRPLVELLETTGRFYGERGLPDRIYLPLPARGLLDAELARRCWTVEAPTIVLTRTLAEAGPGDATTAVTLTETVDDAWRAGYHARDGLLPPHAIGLLQRHDRVRFATVTDGAQTIGIGRGVIDEAWLGITSVEVATSHRRAGVAGAVMAALQSWASGQGARSAYLQVEADNTAARTLYARLGYVEHHRAHYRRAPAA